MKKYILEVIALLLFLSACSSIETEKAVLKPIVEAVFATGTIIPKNNYKIIAQSDGYLRKTLISEGDMVSKGQKLFMIDDTILFEQQKANNDRLTIAELNASDNSPVLLQIKAQIKTAEVNVSNDSLMYERMKRLGSTNSVAVVEIENARLKLESSKNQLNMLLENYSETQLQMEQELSLARSQYNSTEANLGYYTITADINGKMYSIKKENGELVRKGELLGEVGDSNEFVVQLKVDEDNIVKIKTSQQVLVELNTEKNKTYTARVTKIYPSFDETSQSYIVEASFENNLKNLFSGTQVQANIIIRKKDRALLIPRICLGSNDSVVIIKDGTADTVKVQTGIVSNNWVEIIKGLQNGDQVARLF